MKIFRFCLQSFKQISNLQNFSGFVLPFFLILRRSIQAYFKETSRYKFSQLCVCLFHNDLSCCRTIRGMWFSSAVTTEKDAVHSTGRSDPFCSQRRRPLTMSSCLHMFLKYACNNTLVPTIEQLRSPIFSAMSSEPYKRLELWSVPKGQRLL